MVSETEKANSRNVPAIVEFLDGWKARMMCAYTEGLIEYFEEKEMVRRLYNENRTEYETASKVFRNKCNGYYEKKEYTNRWGKTDYTNVKVRDGEYEWLRPYNSERNMEDALKKLERELTQEWNRKYDFIIERTNAIVGTITDAGNLHVGSKGDLNGNIIGTKGIASVQTIGAGGYNIQCFHFRTLINPMK